MITFIVINAILLGVAVLLLIAEKYLITYGECSIVINGDRKLPVPGGDHLLSYLNQHKIYMPSACGGKATCGFCKLKVISGAGDILPTEEAFIDRKEREEGVRLACQVKVKGEVDINIPEYMLGAEEFQAEVIRLEDLTHDIKLIDMKIKDGKAIDFKPGQYIQIKIPGTDEFRAYSVASSPYVKDRVELTIRQVPGGLCSTYVHTALEVGDTVVFTGPFGDFYLREDDKSDIIGIAGGCGMAPIRSIVYYLAEKGMDRKVTYFFGARSKRDLFFTEDFRELEKKCPNFRYLPALSEPKPEDKWDGETGLITHTVEKYVSPKGRKEAYLCGPPPMIDAASVVLKTKGLREETDIFYDKF